MVWLVVSVNGVFYLGDSLDYVKVQNSDGKGKKRFARLMNCRMVDRRSPNPSTYPSCMVCTRYIIFAEEVKLNREMDYRELKKWFSKFPESERIK